MAQPAQKRWKTKRSRWDRLRPDQYCSMAAARSRAAKYCLEAWPFVFFLSLRRPSQRKANTTAVSRAEEHGRPKACPARVFLLFCASKGSRKGGQPGRTCSPMSGCCLATAYSSRQTSFSRTSHSSRQSWRATGRPPLCWASHSGNAARHSDGTANSAHVCDRSLHKTFPITNEPDNQRRHSTERFDWVTMTSLQAGSIN